MPESWTWREVSTPAELGEHAAAWDELARMHGWPLAELAWTASAIRHLESNSDIRLGLLLQDGRLKGAIALAAHRGRFGAVARPVGADALGEANVLLAADETSARQILDHLFRLGRPLALPRMLNAGQFQGYLAPASGRRGKLVEAGSAGFPTLDLADGLDGVLAGLSSNRRNSLRRKGRRLAEAGQVAFSSSLPGEHQLGAELAQFAALEDAGWKGREGSSLRRRPGLYDFLADALRPFARGRRVRFDWLTLDGNLVAIQFGLVSNDRYMLLKPTYDESLSDYSPGYLLTLEAIRQSVQAGLKHYDFLGADDPWKLHWNGTLRDTRTWVFYPFNLRGAAAVSRDLAAGIGRRLRE